MCSVSAVSDYYTLQYPDRFGVQPFSPFQSQQYVDVETKEMMRKVLQLLDKIDKKLGDVECMDETKAQFLKSLDLDPNNIGG